MSWVEFWNKSPSIYVSQRHKACHYALVAADMAALVRSKSDIVVDLGCGEALSADVVAGRCARLLLCEAAPAVRETLRIRFAAISNIAVYDEKLNEVADNSVELLIVNSVIQYLSPPRFKEALRLWRAKLSDGGRLILGDVLPLRGSALQEVWSLLRFAYAEKFFLQALSGLVRTSVSSYPQLRRQLGLQRFSEEEMLRWLGNEGFAAVRMQQNLGHNQSRMAFAARKTC